MIALFFPGGFQRYLLPTISESGEFAGSRTLATSILMNAIAGFARGFMRKPAVFLYSRASFSKAGTLTDHHTHFPRIRRMFT